MRSQGLILFKLEFIVIKFLNAFLYENNIFPVYLFIVSFQTNHWTLSPITLLQFRRRKIVPFDKILTKFAKISNRELEGRDIPRWFLRVSNQSRVFSSHFHLPFNCYSKTLASKLIDIPSWIKFLFLLLTLLFYTIRSSGSTIRSCLSIDPLKYSIFLVES